jgi:hypothetical protein
MADVNCWQGSSISGRSNVCEFVFETSWIREGDTLPAWSTGPLARDNVLDRFLCCRREREERDRYIWAQLMVLREEYIWDVAIALGFRIRFRHGR